jgi:hypothetical protein
MPLSVCPPEAGGQIKATERRNFYKTAGLMAPYGAVRISAGTGRFATVSTLSPALSSALIKIMGKRVVSPVFR